MQDICNQDVLIYRFLPHGSKKIEDCVPLHTIDIVPSQIIKKVKMICHDQETLDSQLYYSKITNKHFELPGIPYPILHSIFKRPQTEYYDHVMLLHSEMQSKDVAWFEQRGSVAVYWWSHAVIARDWFRYAKIDPLLAKSTLPKKDFLIYNRAWSGLREYRIKFTDLVLEHDLQDWCQLTFNPTDDGKHWSEHKFANPVFESNCNDLDQYFSPTTATSSASADYSSLDYVQTSIEVVLETVFDDTKWHLTEKTLRPIACGHPFILAGTPGILKYLRQYGFQTFGDYIDESYDDIQDPVQRLEAIVKLMQTIACMPDLSKKQLFASLQSICKHNKQRFFSDEFFNQVIDEFQTNFTNAFSFICQTDSHKYHERDFKRLVKLQKYFTVS